MQYFGGVAGVTISKAGACAKVALPYASQITRISPCLLSVAVVAVVIMVESYPITLPKAWEYLGK